MSLQRAVSPVLVALASFAFATPAAAKTDTYTFRNTLQSTEGGAAGNTLTAVYNGSVSPAPEGSFVDTTIDAYACPNTPIVRGYSFPAQGGLKSLNTAPIVATGSYTISMIAKFHPLRGGYTRLIDFSDSTNDDGLYILDTAVSLFPVQNFASGTWADDRFSVLTITRDATTKVITAYVGATQVSQLTDSGNLYAAASDLYFFMDNTTGGAPVSESSPGIVTLLRVSDTAVAPTDLPSIVDRACAAAACGNGQVEVGEACDDGNNVDGDGCSSTCRIENSLACTTVSILDAGADPDAGDAGDAGAVDPKNASCASAICDTDAKCGYANGAGSTCTAATAAVVCRSSTCGVVSGKCVAEGGCFVDGDCTSGDTCTVATGMCGSVDAGTPTDAGAISFGDSGLSIQGTGASDAGGCSLTEGATRSGMSAMFVVGIGAVIAAVRRRRRS